MPASELVRPNVEGKKVRQIAFRVDAEMYARYERAAKHDKIRVAALVRRLAEWALTHVEELGSARIVEESRVVPPEKWRPYMPKRKP